MNFRQYFTSVVFILLLLWGPIYDSWQYPLVVRIGYLMIIPLVMWLVLGWVWDYIKPDKKIEDILERSLSVLISCALILFAIIHATSKYHTGNTEVIRTRDGLEDVGSSISIAGPDWGKVFLELFFAILIFWFGVLKKGSVRK